MTPIRRSLLLSLADSYFSLALQIASTAIIARLLTPTEVGVFAVATVFVALAGTFRDFGVAEYLIQERHLNNQKIRAALALNLSVSWAVAALLFAAAPFVGDFYRTPGVTDVMRVQSLSFLLIPFGAVTMAWFRRELNYRPIVICNVLSSTSAFIVAVTLAYHGFSYMSLAWSPFVGVVVSVGAAAWFRPAHLPRLPSLVGIQQVFRFSSFAGGTYLFGQAAKGAPEMVIGRVMTMASVGVFSRANGLVELLRRLMLGPALQVCMPYFAKSGRETDTILPAYLKSVSYVTAVGWPLLGFLAIGAFSAIRIMYGQQWMAAVPLAQVLCLACALELIFVLSREALLARGAARRANELQMGLAALQLLGLSAVIPYGLIGACWGMVCASALGIVLSQWHLWRGIGLRSNDLLRHCMPSLAITLWCVGPAAAWSLLVPVNEQNYWQFGLLGGVSVAALWLVGIALLRHPLWDEIWSWLSTEVADT